MVISKDKLLSKVEKEFLNAKKTHEKLNVLNYEEATKTLNLDFKGTEKIMIDNKEYLVSVDENNKMKVIRIGSYKIVLRDKVEEKFIKHYIETEYNKKKGEKETLVQFYENSNFAIIPEHEYQVLDYIGKDLIEKQPKKTK